MKKCLLRLAATGLFVSCAAVGWSQQKFDETRATLEKWVETRQLISKEKSDWETEKQSLQDSIELLKAEIERLDENIARAEEGTTAADIEREKLLAENDTLKQASAAVAGFIAELEASIQALARTFPPELATREGIQILLQRIPRNPQTTRASLSERMLNVVGLLGEAEKFNSTINLSYETRAIPTGETVQVQTLYIGLGQGYYVDATRRFAGILQPSATGWEVTERNDLARVIGDVLDLYEKKKQPPQFVLIPVEIK
jgi:FtsZ-binding cell division protein ZapB